MSKRCGYPFNYRTKSYIMGRKKGSTSKSNKVKKKIINDVIRNRANEIYQNRIKKDINGDADSDWLQAEKEIMN